jgi:hypothetical protein
MSYTGAFKILFCLWKRFPEWNFSWNPNPVFELAIHLFKRFYFHNVWCLYSNCIFINQIKLFLCFQKFYNIFLSLLAVWKTSPYYRRISPIITKGFKRAEARNRIPLCLPVTRQAVGATKEDKGRSETKKRAPVIIQRLPQKTMSVHHSLENCGGSRIQGIQALGSRGQCFFH